MHHAEIDHWYEQFERLGIRRYMTFATFMHDPARHVAQFEHHDSTEGFRPLLPEQTGVLAEVDLQEECLEMQQHREDIERAMRDPSLLGSIRELEQRVAHLRRIENGHPYEPMRHQRHPR